MICSIGCSIGCRTGFMKIYWLKNKVETKVFIYKAMSEVSWVLVQFFFICYINAPCLLIWFRAFWCWILCFHAWDIRCHFSSFISCLVILLTQYQYRSLFLFLFFFYSLCALLTVDWMIPYWDMKNIQRKSSINLFLSSILVRFMI